MMGFALEGAGLFYDVGEADYHADPVPAGPSLSSSVARILLDQSPLHAWCAHPRLNPAHEPESDSRMDFGSLAHKMLIGRGADISTIDLPDWRTKAAQQLRDAARAEGKISALQKDHGRAEMMVAAARQQLLRIPGCERAFKHGDGEVVGVWEDRLGPWCRMMIDWLDVGRKRTKRPDDVILWDYKTMSGSAAPSAAAKKIFAMGYAFQAEFYKRGLLTLHPEYAGRLRFRFVMQENEAPFALTVVEIDPAAEMIAQKQVAAALQIWDRCLKTKVWPSYPQHVITATLPRWLHDAWIEREMGDEALSSLTGDPFLLPPPPTDVTGRTLSVLEAG